MKKISLFTPCYNEVGNVQKMYEQVTSVMKVLPQYEYEYIFIDNKSTDGTRKILKDIAQRDKRVKLILNIRNFGPDKSGIYGFLQTTGDASICMACDLQDPPELIPQFLNKWENGYKVVWGQKTKTKENKIMYGVRTLYYKIIQLLSKQNQYDQVTGFGLYDKEVMNQIRLVDEPDFLLRNFVINLGYDVGIVAYEQPKRDSGKSHYNFFSYFDTAVKSMVYTSKAPLRIITFTGIILSILSFGMAIYYFILKCLYWNDFSLGTSPILIGVLLFGSIQVLFLGIIGEYLNDILKKLSKKDLVIEEERVNFD